MKTITAQDALDLEISEHPLNCEYKEVRINGEYCSTVGIERAIPTWENTFKPLVDIANGLQIDFAPIVTLYQSKFENPNNAQLITTFHNSSLLKALTPE